MARRLVASFRTFNDEGLPLFVLVPPSDVEAFSELAGGDVTVMDEETLVGGLLVTGPLGEIREGYANQQIVKLAFWESGLLDDYLVLDSDAVFIRPFTRSDFMASPGVPYTVLVEDNDLRCDPVYYREHWQGREVHLREIQRIVGLEDPRLLTCHNHQVFDSRVLASLRTDFMEPRGWSYRDLIAASPYEFSWYNFWLQKSRVIPLKVREPWFKMIHHEGQHAELAMRGLSVEDLVRGYVGLVINSSFAREWDGLLPDEDASVTLSRYVGIGTLTRALARRVGMLPETLRKHRRTS